MDESPGEKTLGDDPEIPSASSKPEVLTELGGHRMQKYGES